jgi:hypothetical protein
MKAIIVAALLVVFTLAFALLSAGCVTTAAQIGTGVAAGSSSASVTHH